MYTRLRKLRRRVVTSDGCEVLMVECNHKMDSGRLKVNRICLHFFVLWSFILIIAQGGICAKMFCNNETFVGKEPLVLKPKDFQPCHDTNNVCVMIPSILHTLCNSSSAQYSFNFSTSFASCVRFHQTGLHDCKMQPGGLRCENDHLSLCYVKGLYNCLLKIEVYVTISNVTAKQFIVHMHQIIKYVKRSSLRVNNLHLAVPSAWKINLTWTRPECEALQYGYYWTWRVAGSRKTYKSVETIYDSKEHPKNSSNITGLKPYTNYTVCIMSRVEIFYEIKGACQTVQTHEAIPLAAPEIYDDESSQLSLNKWQSLIKWKNVDKRDWNGNVEKLRILVYKKEDPNPRYIVVPVYKSSHVIGPLDNSAEYFVVLELCTGGGCTRSKRRFIARSTQNAHEKDQSSTEIVFWVILSCSLVVAIVGAVIVGRRERRNRRSSQDRRTGSWQNLVGPVEIPDTIDPLSNSNEHIYERIEESPYCQIDSMCPSEGASSNLLGRNQPLLRTENEDSLEGASCSKHINTRSLESDRLTDRLVPIYTTLGACGRHVEECDCHVRENGNGAGRGEMRNNCPSMFVVDTIYDKIDRLESSVDDESDINELESFPSSLSYENEPLV